MTNISLSIDNITKTVRGIVALNALANTPGNPRNPLSGDANRAIRTAILSAFFQTMMRLMPYVTNIIPPVNDTDDTFIFAIATDDRNGTAARLANSTVESIIADSVVGAILAETDTAVSLIYTDRAEANTTSLRRLLATPSDDLRITPWP